jgi:hypothetical protein
MQRSFRITTPCSRRKSGRAFLSSAVLAALVVLPAACSEPTSPLAPPTSPTAVQLAKKESSPTKFFFPGVTLTDADGTIFTNATIYATTKQVDHSAGVTVCDYMTENDQSYLGQFQAPVFTSADQVEQFCIENFAART